MREYEQGESLRKVHWRSTAHRGQLMVKELEDAPRDEIAVLLDGDAAVVAGEPPETTFDVAVRAAGSILLAHVRRKRRCVLVLNSAAREEQPVGSEAGDWPRALELLAAAEPTGRTPAFALLEAAGGAVARSLELVVVTSRVDAPLVDRLVQRALSRRGVSLVFVEPASFAGRAPAAGTGAAPAPGGGDPGRGRPSRRRSRGCARRAAGPGGCQCVERSRSRSSRRS